VKFPHNKKEEHGLENHLYLARVKTRETELKMIIHACSIGCVFAAITEAVPDNDQVMGAVIVHMGTAVDVGET
jgi:hypothetical protein